MNSPADYTALDEKNIRSFNGQINGESRLSLFAGPAVVGFVGLIICWAAYFPLLRLSGAAFYNAVLSILFIVANVWVVWMMIFTHRSGEAVLRLALFASRNNLRFFYKLNQLSIPGLIRDSRRTTISGVQLEGSYNGKAFEYQNSYTLGQSYNIMSVRILRSDDLEKHVELPHILFNCRSNDKLFGKNISKYFAESNKISLEGDLDNKFTLHSKVDPITTLSFVSPDLIAIIQDHAHDIDIELYMDRVTIMTNWGYPDKQNIETSLNLVDALRPKIERYFRIQSSIDKIGPTKPI
jgi:hypothetical protein